MTPLRRAVVALCAVLLATSCTTSRLSQDEPVRITGTLLDERGQPSAGGRVVLVKEADLGEALLGFTLAASTLGLVCLADPPPTICARARRATTAADGTFAFQLTGRDTQGSVGNASTFHISAVSAPGPGDTAGPMVTARFQVQTTSLALPALRFWRPRVVVAAGRAEWTPLGAEYGPVAGYTASWAGAEPARPVWSADGPSPLTVDQRVLEDSRGSVAVDARMDRDAPGTSVRVTARSPQVPYASVAGAPPSRGAPCLSYTGPDVAGVALSPCPVTDGDFGSTLAPAPQGTAEARSGVAVDLGRARAVSLVVVRGCPGDCAVESSVDGRSWRILATRSGAGTTVAPPAGTTARWIRVRSPAGADLSRMAEVSVW